jgi:hypothetical protein
VISGKHLARFIIEDIGQLLIKSRVFVSVQVQIEDQSFGLVPDYRFNDLHQMFGYTITTEM